MPSVGLGTWQVSGEFINVEGRIKRDNVFDVECYVQGLH